MRCSCCSRAARRSSDRAAAPAAAAARAGARVGRQSRRPRAGGAGAQRRCRRRRRRSAKRMRARRCASSRASSASISAACAAPGAKGRVTADDVKAFVKEIMHGGGRRGQRAARGADRRLREIRPRRDRAVVAHPEDLGPAAARELGQRAARHAARRSRHHGARGETLGAQGAGAAARHQGNAARVHHSRVRAGARRDAALQVVARARRREPRDQALHAHRFRGRHAERPGRARDSRRRQEGSLRDREGARRAQRARAHGQAAVRRHPGRRVHRVELGRHRRASSSRRSSTRPRLRFSACRAARGSPSIAIWRSCRG